MDGGDGYTISLNYIYIYLKMVKMVIVISSVQYSHSVVSDSL